MPVDLPLPPPPEPASVSQRADFPDKRLELRVAGNLLRISLPAGVDGEALGLELSTAGSVDEALRRLPYLMLAAGQLSVRCLHYREPDGALRVWVKPVPVMAVSGPETLARYFRPLSQSTAPLSPARLEPRRTLAGLYADKVGRLAIPRLLPEGEGLRMHIDDFPQGSAGSVQVSAGNPGNRYVGRRFVDLEAKTVQSGGLELGLFWRESDRLFQSGDADYHEQGLSASLYRPEGQFSLAGRRFDYRVRDAGPLADGEQSLLELAWLTVPRADFRARWTTELKADLIQQSLRSNPGDQLLRRERYPSLSATVQRTAIASWWNRRLDYDFSLLLRQGLGREADQQTASELDYHLLRLGFGARWRLRPIFALETQVAGQWSDNRLPDAQLWALGGPQFLRAWYPGAALGDRGAYVRLSGLFPFAAGRHWQLTPATHLEWGRSDRAGSVDASLADLGVGLDLRYRRNWSASLGSALPLVDNGDPQLLEGARAGYFFRLAASF